MRKEIDYEKKIKTCQLLGADKFKNVVLSVERMKYKIIKKLFPNYIKYVDKIIDKRVKNRIKRLKSQHKLTPKQETDILSDGRNQKLLARKEINWEQNRNYHIDINRPTEILGYLNWNKDVHKKGMIANIGLLTGLSCVLAAGFNPPVIVPLIFGELAALFINFQCVNLQNINIYRIKKNESRIKRLEQKTNQRNIERYGTGARVIGRCLEKSPAIPTVEEVVDNIQTKEELEQLLKLVKATRQAQSKAHEQNKEVDKANSELFTMFKPNTKEQQPVVKKYIKK